MELGKPSPGADYVRDRTLIRGDLGSNTVPGEGTEAVSLEKSSEEAALHDSCHLEERKSATSAFCVAQRPGGRSGWNHRRTGCGSI